MYTGKTDNYLNTNVSNEDFYPSLNIGDFQRDYKMPAEFDAESVSNNIMQAMMETNDSLKGQQSLWQAAGYNTLGEVPASQINNESINLFHYRRAVFCKAKYLAYLQLISQSTKGGAENLGKNSDEIRNVFLTESNNALRALKGQRGRIIAAAL